MGLEFKAEELKQEIIKDIQRNTKRNDQPPGSFNRQPTSVSTSKDGGKVEKLWDFFQLEDLIDKRGFMRIEDWIV